MSNTAITETTNNDNLETNYALKIAFQTMKERCQQLQNRLTFVEKENVALRLECNKNSATSYSPDNKSTEQVTIKKLQEKVEELVKQKSQLTHHLIMVAGENRQMWSRLARLTQENKSLGNHLTSIRDTLKTHSAIDPDILSLSFKDISNANIENNSQSATDVGNKEGSLEEISLKLKNSIYLEKSELEQQYAQMVELQNPLNLQGIGFTYPEDNESNSPDHLKHYESRIAQSKDALFVQNEKLKKIIKHLEKYKIGKGCNNCLKNISKMCQAETQIIINDVAKGTNFTQTSLSAFELNEDSSASKNEEHSEEPNICPLCGNYFEQVPFVVFHEHVLSHFSKEYIDNLDRC